MARNTEKTYELDKIAGRKIKELRIAKGLSRQQLANYIDVTHQQLQKYENGSNRVTFGRMCILAKALGKSITYFCENEYGQDDVPSQHQRMAIEVSRNFMKIKSLKNQNAVNFLVRNLSENE